jgi:hypothetical protein
MMQVNKRPPFSSALRCLLRGPSQIQLPLFFMNYETDRWWVDPDLSAATHMTCRLLHGFVALGGQRAMAPSHTVNRSPSRFGRGNGLRPQPTLNEPAFEVDCYAIYRRNKRSSRPRSVRTLRCPSSSLGAALDPRELANKRRSR